MSASGAARERRSIRNARAAAPTRRDATPRLFTIRLSSAPLRFPVSLSRPAGGRRARDLASKNDQALIPLLLLLRSSSGISVLLVRRLMLAFVVAGVLASLVIERRKQIKARRAMLIRASLDAAEEESLLVDAPPELLNEARMSAATSAALVAAANVRAARAEAAALELEAELERLSTPRVGGEPSRIEWDAAGSPQEEQSEEVVEADEADEAAETAASPHVEEYASESFAERERNGAFNAS